MWIDTHCHLDAHEFGIEAAAVALRARAQGVSTIVIPAVEIGNFPVVAQLAASVDHACYALGIHPLFVAQASEDDLAAMRTAVEAALEDGRFIAIGEIGLDFFLPSLCEAALREKQEHFFREQLKVARDFALPVLLHGRRAHDSVLKHVRAIRPAGGIAHAFNGSLQQARIYLDLGFKLGFGGAMTFGRALQIRRLAQELPLTAIVLETDAPDMSPSWLHPGRNSPEQLPAIGAVLAGLRGIGVEQVAAATSANACTALPRIGLSRPPSSGT